MASSYTHRKLLFSDDSNTTVQVCLYFCDSQKNNTVPSSGFCPTPCLAICPSLCHHPLNAILPANTTSSQPNKPHNLSPMLITMLIVLASAFLLITFYVLYTKLYFHFYHASDDQTRHRRRRVVGGDFVDEEHGPTMVFHPIWYIPTVGLNPTVINSIAVHKYEEGVMDEKDCAVCLGEFVEGDELRVMPKCSHAFHIACIDTWLKSHTNCPLCRAPIVPPSDQHCDDQAAENLSMTPVGGAAEDDFTRGEVVENNLEENNKDEQGLESEREENKGSSSQRWSLERGAANLVSRSLSCSGKIFSSRYNNRPSPNS